MAIANQTIEALYAAMDGLSLATHFASDERRDGDCGSTPLDRIKASLETVKAALNVHLDEMEGVS